MDFLNGYIKNPEAFRQAPLYLSPFNGEALLRNQGLWAAYEGDVFPVLEEEGRLLNVCSSATRALAMVLEDLQLDPEAEVWVLTTRNNRYLSGCVTRTIELYCRWSRQYSSATAAILVNHEFGFVRRDMAALRAYQLPLIEDCAYSYYSALDGRRAGSQGDYAFYSLAKTFPMQVGGLLYAGGRELADASLSASAVRYLKACYAHYSGQGEDIKRRRRHLYAAFLERFGAAGWPARFEPAAGEVPGAFLFGAPGRDLSALKVYLQQQGVECSVFYGEEVFYLPCHQSMEEGHVDYLFTLIKDFLA